MNQAIASSTGLMFGEFLELLRRQGFSIGIDHYLRLQELLDKTGGSCAPPDLKTLLCPIFATNRSQQELFYRTFDAHFVSFQPDFSQEKEQPDAAETRREAIGEGIATPWEEQRKPKAIRSWIYVVAGIWLATLLVALVLLWQPKAGGPPTSAMPTPREIPPAAMPAPGTVTAPATQPPRAPEPEPTFYHRHAKSIFVTAFLTALALLLIYLRYRLRRRQLVLQKRRGKKPPYTWPIRVEGFAPKLYDADRFYAITRHLRRRQADEFQHLDVPATVKATIEALGYPTFCYKAASKQPEYLLLIDRASFRDHQAQFFNGLAKALEQEGVFITRYFYDGDPRVCSGERGGGIPLSELQHTFRGHRLLLFGDGRQLIDPLTGWLAAWVADSFGWQDRALLTPTAPAQWGWKEINLANRFVLLPATVDGLFALIEHFESRSSPDLREWRHLSSDQALPPLGRSDIIQSLRDYLGVDAFQWLCACAVYPELHWDLTLYLGSLPNMNGKLLREENLLRLIRLPWFRTGSIPDEFRLPLIRELDREKEQAIRASILSLLEKNTPPAGSFAADAYRLDLVVQRWLYRRDRKSYGEMLRTLREAQQTQDVRDYALLQIQDTGKASPLDLLLPDRLKKRLYEISLGELTKRLAGSLALLPFRALPPWLSRVLKIAVPSALITTLTLYAVNMFGGRVPLVAALFLFLALPPICALWAFSWRLRAAVSEAFRRSTQTKISTSAPEPVFAVVSGMGVRSAHGRWILIISSSIVLVASVMLIAYLYISKAKAGENQRIRSSAQDIFYHMRAIEVQLVRQRDLMPPAEFERLRNERRKQEQDYDQFLRNLGLYQGKTPVQSAIMRLSRRLGETDLDIPADFYQTTMDYVARWRSTPRLRNALDRARQRNLPQIIRTALDQYGLPREFFFLPLQESSYDATSVGVQTPFGIAKGMWQLIPATAFEYNLRLGPLKDLPQFDPSDQRHDEIASTQAAVRYLAFLYSTKAAASGLLVIASYNYRQTRIINKLDELPNDPRQRNFWNFYRNGWIPKETRDYVMSIFSAALICEKPDLFQMNIEPIMPGW